MSELIIGIDPGASGGIAVIRPDGPACEKMGATERDVFDSLCAIEHDRFNTDEPKVFAFIEAVHSMPKQGVASSFKFGRNYGFLRGCLIALRIPFDEVSPQRWQASLGCRTGGDKNVSKRKAQQLFPHLKITHATADALLIAEYGRRQRIARPEPFDAF